jgi:predicted NUDIX family phosphoesterase
MSMTEKGRELVLCVSRLCVERLWREHDALGPWLPNPGEDVIDEWLKKATVAFLPRSIAEHSEDWLHFATYSILMSGDHVFSYRRGTSGSEDRLHGLTAIGVGGHVGIDDYVASRDITEHMLLLAAIREIDEELVRTEGATFRLAGLIADSSLPVNRVHLGVVYQVETDREHVRVREDCLAEPRWLTTRELWSTRGLETWSGIVVQNLFPEGGVL